MLNLIRRLAARRSIFILVCVVLFSAFEFLICGLLSSVDIGGMLQDMKKSAPPMMQSMMSENFFGDLTSRGMLAFAWNHPIVLALGAAIAIVLAAHAIAGEIESGTIELVLSQPLSRQKYLLAHGIFAISVIGLLSIGGVVGTIVGQSVYKLQMFAPRSMLQLAANFFLLQGGWWSVTLAFSVLGREGGRVSGAAFLLALLSYLVHVIGKLWPAAAFLLPCSLYNYYSPQAILIESKPITGSISILLALIIVCLGFVAWRFQQRDIP